MSIAKLKVGLIGALVVAGIAVPLWQQTRLQRMQSENEQLRAQGTELGALRTEVGRLRKTEADRAELERLRQWRAQTEPELMRLRGMAGVARRANAEAEELRAQLARTTSDAGTNQGAGLVGELMTRTLEQQVAGRVSRMTASLHLTPEQAQAARDILMRQAQVASAGMQQLFSGKYDKESLAKLGKDGGNPEEQIKALLTPDQRAAYQSYQQEEAAHNARLAANMELLQMQTTVGLTSEQQDRVFAALYDVSFSQLSGSATQTFAKPADQIQWALDQKAKALASVLTPAQLEGYRQQQGVQLKFLKDILEKMDGANKPK